ncbi:terminase family protein, partial [Candidatus Bathycorpusculum sp.]|uniref:terminase large subunit domain-containing protein n=1 Tax=Candidatus Bathycorpusculum sp. TaxID=2994959 RepID=UPI00283303FA|nr:terminase family protein [Candidatus Termitimicrobium sp.]MCL2432747.1 terminase family protein [Candidatus Termitimicrobium sp.]
MQCKQHQPLRTITLLGYPATLGQQQITGAVLNPECRRLVICAMTRYGKTRFAAIGLLLLIANTPIALKAKPKRIIIIAPRVEQTKILRSYISEHIAANPILSALLDDNTRTTTERLKKETSKRLLTFKNGWSILTLTAHAGKNEDDPASNLMGWGGDIIVLDEACLIRQDVYTSRISRMLGDDPQNSKLIILANPWSKNNFVWDAYQNPTYKKIQIGYQQALAEGRITSGYLDEQKAILSPYEWKVLYESEFADESEDTLIRYEWIEQAVQRHKDQTIQFSSQPRM